jgi:FMN phosphatase YigB (HAD superfamily)
MFDYVFVDFDKTIFDCLAFEKDMWKVAQDHGVSAEDYKETYKQAIHPSTKDEYNYTFEGHIQFLKLRGCSNAEGLLGEWNSLLQNNYLFDGADVFLEFLRANSTHLILLTAGNKEFQMKKISSVPVQRYFDEIVVLDGHKDEYLSSLKIDFSNSLFLNDSMRENVILKQRFPDLNIIVRFEKFDEHKYTEDQMKEFGTPFFETLSGIQEYIKSIL